MKTINSRPIVLVITSSRYYCVAKLTIATLKKMQLEDLIEIQCLVMGEISDVRFEVPTTIVKDTGYGACLVDFIDSISAKSVITWIEDRVPLGRGRTRANLIEAKELSLLNYRKLSCGPPYSFTSKGSLFGPGDSRNKYQISFTIAMWDVGFLKKYIKKNWTAWDIERNAKNEIGLERSSALPRFLGPLRTGIKNKHLIIRGKINREINVHSSLYAYLSKNFKRQTFADFIKEKIAPVAFTVIDFLAVTLTKKI